MLNPEVAARDKLSQFIQEYTGDRYCLRETLRFFGRHPNIRASQAIAVHAVNGRSLYTERALGYLVNKGVLRASLENGVPFYSLTANESLRSLAVDLARCDCHQQQPALGRVYPEGALFNPIISQSA